MGVVESIIFFFLVIIFCELSVSAIAWLIKKVTKNGFLFHALRVPALFALVLAIYIIAFFPLGGVTVALYDWWGVSKNCEPYFVATIFVAALIALVFCAFRYYKKSLTSEGKNTKYILSSFITGLMLSLAIGAMSFGGTA